MRPSGVGFDRDSSEIIARGIDEAIAQLKKSITITFGRPLDEMRDSLNEIYRECSHENWDGDGAAPITAGAYEEARRIIDVLPSSIPAPEIVAEPTGDIGFEWRRGQGQILVISVGGKYRIAFAGIFAGNKVHGTEYYSDRLPSAIMQHLRRLYK